MSLETSRICFLTILPEEIIKKFIVYSFFLTQFLETWTELNNKYRDIQELLIPTEARLNTLDQLTHIFARGGSVSTELTSVSTDKVDGILKSLTKYQNQVNDDLVGELTEAQQAEVDTLFANIKDEIARDPQIFLIDVVSWLDNSLANAGRQGIINTSNQRYLAKRTDTGTAGAIDVVEEVIDDNANAYLQEINEAAGKRVSQFVEDETGRTQLINAEDSIVKSNNWRSLGLLASAGYYTYTLAIGTNLPLLTLLGPFILYKCKELIIF